MIMAVIISRFVNNMNMYHLLYNPQATPQLSGTLFASKSCRNSYNNYNKELST